MSWAELASDAAELVLAAADRPYDVFGHSMGGWMAFDVTVRIERAGARAPDRLISSSCNAPYRGVTEQDRFPHPDDDDAALLAWMTATGSLPDYAAADDDLRQMAVELMRADIRVRDSYRPAVDVRTGVPVEVLHGVDDTVIDPEVATQWRAVAGDAFKISALPGGHFYTPEVWRGLPEHFHAARAVTAA
jgi:surfactin synthase thioesterase subunit